MLRRWEGPGVERLYRLAAANAPWGQRGYEFRTEYLQLISKTYGAALRVVDFRGDLEMCRRLINHWVDGMTDHAIPALVGPGTLEPTTRLVLANAIAFKAQWSHEFHPEGTSTERFFIAQGKAVEVPMMHQGAELAYAAVDDVQLVSLPYRGGDFAMVVILPRRPDGLGAVETTITGERLDGWLAKLGPRNVILSLPKFRADASLDLSATLAGMGMPSAFAMSADFGGITHAEPIWLSSVIHRAVVKVDEEGTEAAAATAAVMKSAEVPPLERRPPVLFQVNHPFLYVIRDVKTGAILFLGHVVDPSR